MVTSGCIRVLRTHASYTVLVVGRGPFATSGRILSFRTHACYTVKVVDHRLYPEFGTQPITQDACVLYGSSRGPPTFSSIQDSSR